MLDCLALHIFVRADDLAPPIAAAAGDAVLVRGVITEGLVSMALSVAIVVRVVGLFIGPWRATLIPAVAFAVSASLLCSSTGPARPTFKMA
jgi:hypothetical protein